MCHQNSALKGSEPFMKSTSIIGPRSDEFIMLELYNSVLYWEITRSLVPKPKKKHIPEKSSGISIMLEPSLESPGPHKEVPSEKKLQARAHTRAIITLSISLYSLALLTRGNTWSPPPNITIVEQLTLLSKGLYMAKRKRKKLAPTAVPSSS